MLRSNDRSFTRYDYPSACSFYMSAIIVTLICQALAAFISSGLSRTYPNISGNGDFNTAFMIFIQLVNAAFIYLYSKFRKRKLNFNYFISSASGKRVGVLDFLLPPVCAVLLLIGMYLPTLWYGYFIHDVVGVPPEFGEITINTASATAMIVIASVFLAPVCEESIYRGVLLHGMNDRFSAVKAVALSALAFMLMHMNPLQVVFQFAMGLLCGFVALRAKKLLPSILLHACGNALALVLDMTPLSAVLNGCGLWLTDHIAAAFFITLALFAGAGGALFAIVRFGFGYAGGANAEQSGKGSTESVGGEKSQEPSSTEAGGEKAANTEDDDAAKIAENIRLTKESLRIRDARVKYFIGIGISFIMLVLGLVSALL